MIIQVEQAVIVHNSDLYRTRISYCPAHIRYGLGVQVITSIEYAKQTMCEPKRSSMDLTLFETRQNEGTNKLEYAAEGVPRTWADELPDLRTSLMAYTSQ